MTMSQKRPYLFLVVGAHGVGKTSLLAEFIWPRTSHEDQLWQIQEARAENIDIDGREVKLVLRDSMGRDYYDAFRPLLYPAVSMVLVCFAVNDRLSFVQAQTKFLRECKEYAPGVPYILVGCKSDTREERIELLLVSKEEANLAATGMKAYRYMECSATAHEGVREVFETATRLCMRLEYDQHYKKQSRKIAKMSKKCSIM
ncbi:hypothetical protein G9P44_003450 [Scheffersomyces stipitis]|nr:hypothetical protein G9P44_003450 [Scheffersomyces stipitis]